MALRKLTQHNPVAASHGMGVSQRSSLGEVTCIGERKACTSKRRPKLRLDALQKHKVQEGVCHLSPILLARIL